MRKLVYILLGCTILLLGGYAGYRGYKVWKENRLVGMAKEFLAKHDFRNATLSLSQALQTNPMNLEACRLMAKLAEDTRSPVALTWRSRVVDLAPNSTEDRLALCRAALAIRDLATATNALQGVSETGKSTYEFQNMSGLIAVATGRLDDATKYFSEASRLQPTNSAPKLNLAILGIKNTNATTQAEGRDALHQLTKEEAFRCQALRELVLDAVNQRERTEAVALVRDLVRQTNATFADKLLHLDVLRLAGDPSYADTLTETQTRAASGTNEVTEMGAWLVQRKSPSDALQWLVSLPEATQTNLAVAILTSDCRVATSDWPGLQTSLEPQNWGDLDYLRHAYLSRSLRGQDLGASAKTEWQLAVKGANNQRAALGYLLRVAGQWRWENEGEEILWTIVNRYPDAKWALSGLQQMLFAGGRTRSLLTLFNQVSRANPADLGSRNNLAMTALLLDAQENKPHDLAREVYEKSPTNAAFASTYAFSLHLQGKDDEALKVLKQLPPRELENPSIAGYYGLVLKATGNAEIGKTYLRWAEKASLLPEERKLFTAAQSGS